MSFKREQILILILILLLIASIVILISLLATGFTKLAMIFIICWFAGAAAGFLPGLISLLTREK